MEMSEILLYVKEELSCSVTLEEEDLTVESFRKNVLNEVDDILNFPYKFTRLVNNKRVVNNKCVVAPQTMPHNNDNDFLYY